MIPIELGGTTFPGRVWTAAGCGGTGRELAAYADLARLGGFVTRTITVRPRQGPADRRWRELPGGLLHTDGLQNPGLDGFLATELPWLAQQQAPVVVSVAAEEPAEYAELARRVGASPGVRGVEVNLSAPEWADDPRRAAQLANPFQVGKILGTVRAEVPRGLPVLAKLGARDDAAALARAAQDAGADAVVLANAPPGHGGRGAGPMGLSGPALRPLALRAVAAVHAEVTGLPVVGVGGVASATDARAFLDAGAVAVQVGTACLLDPTAALCISEDLDPDTEPDTGLDGADPEGHR